MTPEQMRRAALLLSDTDAYNLCSSEEADALARLLREQAEAMGWRPIETAPRDGTQIVLGRTDWLSMPVAKWGTVDADDGAFGAWLIDDPNFCAGVEDGVLGWNEDIEEGSMPTHWMPLLPPQDGGR